MLSIGQQQLAKKSEGLDHDIWRFSRLNWICRVIKELQSRFKYLMETGDDSKIPGDLQRSIFATVGDCIFKGVYFTDK